MSPEIIGLLFIILMLVMIFSGIWIGVAMALAGFLGYVALEGWDKAVGMVGIEPFAQIFSYTFTCIPLFMFMGAIAARSNLVSDLYETATKWVGQLRAGLGIATVAATAVFSAVCGSSFAADVTMGRIAIPEMRKHGYHPGLSAALVAAAATMGALIPPSLAFIIYGVLTEQSVGQLFMAGVFPGILEALFYIGTLMIIGRIRPRYFPSSAPRVTWGKRFSSLRLTAPVLVLILVIMGGIYGGFFTPTEAAGVGCLFVVIIAIALRRLKFRDFTGAVAETVISTAMIVLLITGAFILMRVITVSGLAEWLAGLIAGLSVSRYWILLMIILFYIVLGCFIDMVAMTILTVPIIYPIIVALGFDPLWFGVIMVRVGEVGLITPPIGMNVFVLSASCDIPVGTIFRGVGPFVAADVVHIALLVAVPEIALWLPRTM